RAVGQILRDGVRQVDLAGRYGGEEFALILPETDLFGAVKLAERLRVELETTPIAVSEGKTLKITASFGVAAVAHGDPSLSDNIGRADAALYAAKDAGRNRVMLEGTPALEAPAIHVAS
ncbi:MAG: GGDEF domain-containing protein, partial [Tardiphaga sp.]